MFLTVTISLFEGLAVTVKLFALTLLFALPLGLVISFGSMSKLMTSPRGRANRRVSAIRSRPWSGSSEALP